METNLQLCKDCNCYFRGLAINFWKFHQWVSRKSINLQHCCSSWKSIWHNSIHIMRCKQQIVRCKVNVLFYRIIFQYHFAEKPFIVFAQFQNNIFISEVTFLKHCKMDICRLKITCYVLTLHVLLGTSFGQHLQKLRHIKWYNFPPIKKNNGR